jgi:malate dehydrogenase (oxaloacetate-decarboxylating)(NADP+)
MDTSPRFSPFSTFLLHDAGLNKGTAFSEQERDALGLRGLLPPRVHSPEQQMMRVLDNLAKKPSELEQYIFLIGLQDRNETLFYRTVIDHLEKVMPIIYTPTVGRACQDYGHVFRRPKGIFISVKDAGRIASILRNWPTKKVRVIVVTDGERVLGLGDLGADGMGIPVGKLALYTACGGIHPSACLPVTIDVGTDNENLLKDPLYIGIQQRRVRGAVYDDLLDEFVTAVQEVFPDALIQFEDVADYNAFRLLNRYRGKVRMFNDDIQGTGAMVLAGVYSALRIAKRALVDQRFLFFGAGQEATGIADLLVSAMGQEGLSTAEARKRCWFFAERGLVVKSQANVAEHARRYVQDQECVGDPLTVIDSFRPTELIGVAANSDAFTKSVLRRVSEINERPVIFALADPSSRAERIAVDACYSTDGRAIFASEKPFPRIAIGGRRFVSNQANNAYIFPGIALGIVASGSRLVVDEMFLLAAHAVAAGISNEDACEENIYPPISRIREVSLDVACATAEVAYRCGLATRPKPADLRSAIKAEMYEPKYPNYV